MKAGPGLTFVVVAVVGSAALLCWVWSTGADPEPAEPATASRSAAHAAAQPTAAPTPGKTAAAYVAAVAATPRSPTKTMPAVLVRGLESDPSGGVRVADTPPGSLGDFLKLQRGDVIIAMGGKHFPRAQDYAREFRNAESPEELTVLRGGQELQLR